MTENCRRCGMPFDVHVAFWDIEQMARTRLNEGEFSVPTKGIYCPPVAD